MGEQPMQILWAFHYNPWRGGLHARKPIAFGNWLAWPDFEAKSVTGGGSRRYTHVPNCPWQLVPWPGSWLPPGHCLIRIFTLYFPYRKVTYQQRNRRAGKKTGCYLAYRLL
jgi:hypothetical protein